MFPSRPLPLRKYLCSWSGVADCEKLEMDHILTLPRGRMFSIHGGSQSWLHIKISRYEPLTNSTTQVSTQNN